METLNTAFFFVCDKLISLQSYFIGVAREIAYVVLLIAICMAALNYGLTGAGIKESVVKIIKATAFFAIMLVAYPTIIDYMTSWTFQKAKGSTYDSIAQFMDNSKTAIAEAADNTAAANKKGTYSNTVTKSKAVSDQEDPALYFSGILKTHRMDGHEYKVIAPAAAMQAVLLVAGECFRFSDEGNGSILTGKFDLFKIIIGLICAFFVIFTGAFAVLEYIMAFLEYLLITSVGIILFPFSLWDGTKFLAEKLVGAIIGFFVKLLFCNICIFLMLYGFLTIAKGYSTTPFTGTPDEIVTIIFICLLFFFICKSAPGLAQSLLTGTPTLNAAGAIASSAAAIGAAAKVGGMVASGGAKAAFGAAGAGAQAGAAAGAVKELGGGATAQAGAALKSLGSSAANTVKGGAGDLARSLLGSGGGSGGGGGGGAGAGVNRHSETQKFLSEKNADGTKKTFGENIKERTERGTNIGLDYMAKQEAKQNAGKESNNNNPDYKTALSDLNKQFPGAPKES
ncbi:MAG: hypothetical protein Ta2G_13480 [Termitinemataceae bacterium]|nr:MAG: hypothetical protein Ta2G_13480 [Termitinemataceae bacterium]